MNFLAIFGILAGIFSFISYPPYIVAILKGETKNAAQLSYPFYIFVANFAVVIAILLGRRKVDSDNKKSRIPT